MNRFVASIGLALAVTGAVSVPFMKATLALSALLFLASAAGFLFFHNPWPLLLALPVLAWLAAYSLTKRFTPLCHFWLGLSLGLAPLSAWIAIAGNPLDPRGLTILLLGLGVTCWVAGFDILYACQDYACDVSQGLHSVPSKLGIKNALLVSRLTHTLSALLLLSLTFTTPLLGPIYLTGATLACLLLLYEHSLVSPTDLSNLNLAFFTVNGLISCLLATLGIVDIFL